MPVKIESFPQKLVCIAIFFALCGYLLDTAIFYVVALVFCVYFLLEYIGRNSVVMTESEIQFNGIKVSLESIKNVSLDKKIIWVLLVRLHNGKTYKLADSIRYKNKDIKFLYEEIHRKIS